MKVDIKIEPSTRGLIFKKHLHKLMVKVEFTPEERQSIQKAHLEERSLCFAPPITEHKANQNLGFYGQVNRPYKVSSLFKGYNVGDFPDLVSAMAAKKELIEGLQALKILIEATQEPTDESFEL